MNACILACKLNACAREKGGEGERLLFARLRGSTSALAKAPERQSCIAFARRSCASGTGPRCDGGVPDCSPRFAAICSVLPYPIAMYTFENLRLTSVQTGSQRAGTVSAMGKRAKQQIHSNSVSLFFGLRLLKRHLFKPPN